MSASTPAAAAASPPLFCEIWIRSKGARRQAHFRHMAAGAPTGGWKKLGIPAADRALRTGKLELHPEAALRAVAHVPDEEEDASDGVASTARQGRTIDDMRPSLAQHPMHAGFASQAQALNRQIDAVVGSGIAF